MVLLCLSRKNTGSKNRLLQHGGILVGISVCMTLLHGVCFVSNIERRYRGERVYDRVAERNKFSCAE